MKKNLINKPPSLRGAKIPIAIGRSALLFLFLLMVNMLYAQEPVEMAEGMRSSGKIYVVVSSLAVIFAGLAIYLFMLDRRLRNLENELRK